MAGPEIISSTESTGLEDFGMGLESHSATCPPPGPTHHPSHVTEIPVYLNFLRRAMSTDERTTSPMLTRLHQHWRRPPVLARADPRSHFDPVQQLSGRPLFLLYRGGEPLRRHDE